VTSLTQQIKFCIEQEEMKVGFEYSLDSILYIWDEKDGLLART
jgi:hypothetical protein